MLKLWEFLDLPPTVGPACTIASRFLPAPLSDHNTYHTLSSRFCSWAFEALVSSSVSATKSSIEVLYEGGDLGKVLNQIHRQLKIQIKVQYFSHLAKGVKHLRREEEAILEQSNRRNLVRVRDCYHDISCKGVPRNDVRNGGNYVNIDERFHKRRNYGRSSQSLGTVSGPISYNKFKLPLLCGTFGPYDYEASFDVDHMLKCSSPCAYLEKQLLVSIPRIKPSYHNLELVHDNLFFGLLVAIFSSSFACMWSKIHLFFGSFVESGYDERVSWFPWSLYSNFHAKFKGELVENCEL
ncbi:hypothetical protein M9H77_18500 [Catharanthus roseus]|uniref:Uncharacterized protein n=1 Tax=Catharanthus roseus TaxID=4058 RepID=A0ACC0B7T2_CATRO|nr:hypothetical protein M9H77_18500 [Catharanthus roseus]